MSKIAAASLAGLGAAGAGGFGIYYFKDSEAKIISIKDRLISEGFKILSPSEQSHGTDLKNAYNGKKSSADKVFEVTNTDINEETLKTLCDGALKKEKDDTSYSKAKRGCVVPVSITQHLTNLKLNPLSTTGSDSQGEGNKIVTEYEKDENSGKRFSDLSTLSDQKGEKIRDKCNTLSSKKNYDDDFDTSLESSMRGCVASSVGKAD